MNRQIVVIAHNLRSCHNVGALFRTAEGMGVNTLYLTGYTPFPQGKQDERLPHLVHKITKQIEKTALGSTTTLPWEHHESIIEVIKLLRRQGYMIFALEQTPSAINLATVHPPEKSVLILGNEVEGLDPDVIGYCDQSVQIPMIGKKESFNVIQAAAMALYHFRFTQN